MHFPGKNWKIKGKLVEAHAWNAFSITKLMFINAFFLTLRVKAINNI